MEITWGTILSVLSAVATVTALISFSRNTSKDKEEKLRKEISVENAVSQLTIRFNDYEAKTDAQFDAINHGIDDLTKSVRERDRKMDMLLFEHTLNHPKSKMEVK